MLQCERILVPLDASALAEKALGAALLMAHSFGADVWLLHVRPDAASLDADKAEDEMDELEQEAQNLIGLAEPHLPEGFDKSRLHATVRAGNVVKVITTAADELSCDLIVMGTHGRAGIAELFTGSTTERVLANTAASLFIVKPEGFPYLRD